MDLAIEIPPSPLTAVMAHEVWEEYYDRLAALIGEHKTTLVFVNTRRLAERVARHLADRLGDESVTAHHGSLSKERRLDAEHRLKSGSLKALVATASLELGIDIGHVDLVCQIGSPHRIATLLQRVGRSGHSIAGVPEGRLFPESLDDLVECAALLRSSRRGELDAIVSHDAPLDVLAQQITAETSCAGCGEDDLFALARKAWPYRALPRPDFDAVVAMVSDGFATPRGRRSALVHRDEINRALRGRRGSRLLSLVSGGAIPEVADYRVVLEPEDTFIGTVNEDFAIESLAGDIFQLGNASWQITQVLSGTVRVRDAQGAPPTIPFWIGEAPARSDELSVSVSELRAGVDSRLAMDGPSDQPPLADGELRRSAEASAKAERTAPTVIDWLIEETGVSREAAQQVIDYLGEGRRVLGVVPTQSTLVIERFFDEAGGMQLVLHAPFGSRVNRAWALALRKRFCRQFNFELQAAATEDAVLLSLGPQHSFPLADVFRYLHPATVRDILVQAFLDAPVFQTRWRWNATISLAVPRNRGGRKVPPQLQRMQADDLMAAVFPDAAACLENIPGDRQIPDHPLVSQTVRDCLEEAMDLPQLQRVLERIHRGEVTCISRDTPEPSAFCHDILNARPYAFVDDAPLEERRTQAVQTRRAGNPGEVGALDTAAIERVRDEVRPDPRDVDECHDALLTCGFLFEDEVEHTFLAELATHRRATRVSTPVASRQIWLAAERLPEWLAVHPDTRLDPIVDAPPSRTARAWTSEAALVELLRGRLAILGPTTATSLSDSIGLPLQAVDDALLTLESEGVVLRGSFTSPRLLEWCERRLLARIHRYTLNRLRAEIAPVSPAEFMRFLFAWQHVGDRQQLTGIDGLRAVLAQLDGLELPARTWERDVLPARLERYESSLLDTLCLTGEVGWARLSSGPTQVVGATPIALFLRTNANHWYALRGDDSAERRMAINEPAQWLLQQLHRHRQSDTSRAPFYWYNIEPEFGLHRRDLNPTLDEQENTLLQSLDLELAIAAGGPATRCRTRASCWASRAADSTCTQGQFLEIWVNDFKPDPLTRGGKAAYRPRCHRRELPRPRPRTSSTTKTRTATASRPHSTTPVWTGCSTRTRPMLLPGGNRRGQVGRRPRPVAHQRPLQQGQRNRRQPALRHRGPGSQRTAGPGQRVLQLRDRPGRLGRDRHSASVSRLRRVQRPRSRERFVAPLSHQAVEPRQCAPTAPSNRAWTRFATCASGSTTSTRSCAPTPRSVALRLQIAEFSDRGQPLGDRRCARNLSDGLAREPAHRVRDRRHQHQDRSGRVPAASGTQLSRTRSPTRSLRSRYVTRDSIPRHADSHPQALPGRRSQHDALSRSQFLGSHRLAARQASSTTSAWDPTRPTTTKSRSRSRATYFNETGWARVVFDLADLDQLEVRDAGHGGYRYRARHGRPEREPIPIRMRGAPNLNGVRFLYAGVRNVSESAKSKRRNLDERHLTSAT